MNDKEEHAGQPRAPESPEDAGDQNSDEGQPAGPAQTEPELTTADEEPSQPAPVPLPEPDPGPDPAAEGLAMLLQVQEKLDEVAGQAREHHRIDQLRQKIIDDLHAENQKLKEGELRNALLPVLKEMMEWSDNLVKSARAYRDGRAATAEEVAQEFEAYAEMVLDFADRYDIALIEPAPGDKFNPRQEKAVAAAAASEPDQDRTIARVLRPGYSFMGRMVRPADVEVFKYQTPKAPAPAEAVPPGAD